jgi:uncharacterized protein YbjT (DUF2867 family)
MNIREIAIIGGTGFVGLHIVSRLTKQGYRIRVLTRRRERHRQLLVIPNLQLCETNVHNGTELQRQLADCDAVINLVGILNETGDDGQGFRLAHVELPQKIVAACAANGIRRLLQMSALKADAQSGPSHYLQTKGEGEAYVHAAQRENLLVTSFRPSVIFGPEDSFLNRFAGLLRIAPFFFPLACPNSRFAPVFVGDVAEAFARALPDVSTAGNRYDLCGPQDYTLAQLVNYTAGLVGRTVRVVELNPTMSLQQARLLEHFPGKPFSLDNYRSLQVDSVCEGALGLTALGIKPTALETIAPTYLDSKTVRARYQFMRSYARRQ